MTLTKYLEMRGLHLASCYCFQLSPGSRRDSTLHFREAPDWPFQPCKPQPDHWRCSGTNCVRRQLYDRASLAKISFLVVYGGQQKPAQITFHSIPSCLSPAVRTAPWYITGSLHSINSHQHLFFAYFFDRQQTMIHFSLPLFSVWRRGSLLTPVWFLRSSISCDVFYLLWRSFYYCGTVPNMAWPRLLYKGNWRRWLLVLKNWVSIQLLLSHLRMHCQECVSRPTEVRTTNSVRWIRALDVAN